MPVRTYCFYERRDVYRLLRDSNGGWRLRGTDEAFARKLFEQHGVLDFSRAYYENDRIRIVDGILKDYEASILRVNRRAQTAQIRVDICGRETLIWLGFEWMNSNEGGEIAARLHDKENGNAQTPV